MSTTIPPVIESRAARVALGDATLLHDVALAVAPGERVAIVGHNGAGKSTLLKALVGFAPVTRGSLRVLQTQLEQPPDAAALRALRTKVALIHQGLHLVGRLSVLDNVLIGGAARYRSPLSWLRRWPVEEQRAAHAVLWQVGLGWAARRRTDSLSGGERQKVAIARALHQRAEILLADEPTASLDADAARDVARTLAEAATRHGAALVCVVHDLDLVPQLAGRAIALRRGSVVADVAVTAETPERLRGMMQ